MRAPSFAEDGPCPSYDRTLGSVPRHVLGVLPRECPECEAWFVSQATHMLMGFAPAAPEPRDRQASRGSLTSSRRAGASTTQQVVDALKAAFNADLLKNEAAQEAVLWKLLHEKTADVERKAFTLPVKVK